MIVGIGAGTFTSMGAWDAASGLGFVGRHVLRTPRARVAQHGPVIADVRLIERVLLRHGLRLGGLVFNDERAAAIATCPGPSNVPAGNTTEPARLSARGAPFQSTAARFLPSLQ